MKGEELVTGGGGPGGRQGDPDCGRQGRRRSWQLAVRILGALVCASAPPAQRVLIRTGIAQDGRSRAVAIRVLSTRARFGGIWSRNSNGFGGGGTCARLRRSRLQPRMARVHA
jgi:hypothetical protein